LILERASSEALFAAQSWLSVAINTRMRKIAFCLSGQPRTWKKCYQSWFNLFRPYGEIDVFFHMWDYNTDAAFAGEYTNDGLREFLVSKEEQQEIISTFCPKAFIFDSKKDTNNITVKVKNVIADYSHNQFYSIWRSANIKRQYEIQNNFQYDVAVRLRSDIFFNLPWEPHGFGYESMESFFQNIRPSTIYTSSNVWSDEYALQRLSDGFFLADSLTFDHATMFYDALGYMDAADATVGKIHHPPESSLYFYLASVGIVNAAAPLPDSRLLRDFRHVARVGKLETYETS
jgi:hypothetical protein